MFLQTTDAFKQLRHITFTSNASLAEFQEMEGDTDGVITAIEAAKHQAAVWATRDIIKDSSGYYKGQQWVF